MDELGPRSGIDLLEDVIEVALDRSWADPQTAGDLLVGQAPDDQPDDLQLRAVRTECIVGLLADRDLVVASTTTVGPSHADRIRRTSSSAGTVLRR